MALISNSLPEPSFLIGLPKCGRSTLNLLLVVSVLCCTNLTQYIKNVGTFINSLCISAPNILSLVFLISESLTKEKFLHNISVQEYSSWATSLIRFDKGTKTDCALLALFRLVGSPRSSLSLLPQAPSLVRSIKTWHALVKNGKLLTKKGMCRLDGFLAHKNPSIPQSILCLPGHPW